MPHKGPATLPLEKFFGKYWRPLSEAETRDQRGREPNILSQLMQQGSEGAPIEIPRLITSDTLLEEFAQWWPIRLLREAAAEEDVEGYKRLLHYVLLRLEVAPPTGVLIPFRWKRGRPDETHMIYEAWLAMGRPTLRWRVLDDLAQWFYPDRFAAARSDAKLRKILRDRIRGTILRHEKANATKTPSVA